MIKKVIILFLGSLISITCMFNSIKVLSFYRIRNISEIGITLSSVFNILLEDSSKRTWLLVGIISALIAIAISVSIIICLLSLFSCDVLSNLISKIAIVLWIGLLLLIVFVLAYYLLFVIIIMLLAILAILTLPSIAYSSDSSGPVHVRSYYRKGSYVRSYNRRRPRH